MLRHFLLIVGCLAALELTCAVGAAEIRQFELRTIESLGRQLHERLQSGGSSMSAFQKQAEESARRALHLAEKNYRFAVLNDPDGSGFLVYAIRESSNRDEIVVGKHFRVTTSADGKNVERVDALSQNDYSIAGSELTTGSRQVAFWWQEVVSDKPVETLVYLTLRYGQPCYVVTRDHSLWKIDKGKISKTRQGAGTPADQRTQH